MPGEILTLPATGEKSRFARSMRDYPLGLDRHPGNVIIIQPLTIM